MAEPGEGPPTSQPEVPINSGNNSPMRTERPLETGQGDPTRSEQAQVDRALAKARESLAKHEEELAAYKANPERPRIPPMMGGSPALDPDRVKERIFGSRNAFSLRWTRQYEIDDLVDPPPASGIKVAFDPAVALSKLLATGFSGSLAGQQASALIEDSKNEEFKVAAWTGLIPAFILDHQMRTKRLDGVEAALSGNMGLRPDGLAQWLSVDIETRRALTLLLHLQGVEVLDEPGFNDIEKIDRVAPRGYVRGLAHRFSDVGIGQQRFSVPGSRDPEVHSYDITKAEIDKYLQVVAEVAETDPGIVRIAYTFFRVLGFPHENRKFSELWSLHTYDPGRKEKAMRDYWARRGTPGRVTRKMIDEIAGRGDFAPDETGTLIDEWKDPRDSSRSLREVLGEEGVLGLSDALNDLGTAEFQREWKDETRKLDVMDRISDIRNGTGGSSATPAIERLSKLLQQEEYHILGAKRKISDATKRRILDTRKISAAKGASEMSFMDNIRMQWRLLLSSHGIRPPQPSIKGDRRTHEGWESQDFDDAGYTDQD